MDIDMNLSLETDNTSASSDNTDFPFPIVPFKSCIQVLRNYGSFFIICCIRYLNIHTERIINDYGGYQPKGASFSEMVQAVTGNRLEHCEEWLRENSIPSIEHCNEMISVLPEYIRRCTVMTQETSSDKANAILTIESLKQAFFLSELETYILVTCALIQFDELYTHAWRYITGAERTELPATSFFMNIFEFMAKDESELRACFDPNHNLLRYGLLSLKYMAPWERDTPLTMLSVTMPGRVLSYILGATESYTPTACRWLSDIDDNTVNLDNSTLETLQKHLSHAAAHLAFLGYKGIGRATAISYVSKRLSMPVLELDFHDLCTAWIQSSESIPHSLSAILREIRIRHAFLLIRYESVESDYMDWLKLHANLFHDIFIQESDLRFGVLLEHQTLMSRLLFGELSEIQFPKPSRDIQLRLWNKALSRILPEERSKDMALMLSTGYCLSYSEMNAVIEQTLTRVGGSSPLQVLTADHISDTLNKTRGHNLEGMATLRSTSLLLKDIVLSEDIRSILNEILSYARFSERVMVDWGFSKYNSSGAGLSVLLSGVPGTGKTLTALVLAHELGRALYVVDLSRVVDKYIGETEKKLSIIFDEAEHSQSMLLFDEADSLFAKRTDVKSSNDRYANLEVNYLLQRLESYRGVSILTTNFGGGLDEALARRIQFKVNFPMPDEEQRAELWKRLIPPNAPCSEDIDLESLASGFEMSGGHIKNAIFRASILAAASDQPINHELLWDAAVHEYRSMGHIIREYEGMSE